MIVISNALAISEDLDIPLTYPVIGWQNLVTVTNIEATSELSSYPATNLANPQTASKWVSDPTDASDVYITVTLNTAEEVDYIGVAGHNFGTGEIAVSVEIEGGDISAGGSLDAYGTSFGDGTTGGGLDAAFDGDLVQDSLSSARVASATDMYVGRDFGDDPKRIWSAVVTSSDNVGFGGGTGNYTLELYAKVGTPANSTDGTLLDTEGPFSDGNSIQKTLTSNNNSALWDHIWVRLSTDGAAQVLAICEIEFTEATTFQEAVEEVMPGDDAPLLMRFEPQEITSIRLRLQQGSEDPEAAVVYVGKLLVFERGVQGSYTPLPYGRVANVVTGRAESGDFLGRIVTNSKTESDAVFIGLTPSWVRENIVPFIEVAPIQPFFFAWNPEDFPLEVGFAWATNDPQPEFTLDGWCDFRINMAGIVA